MDKREQVNHAANSFGITVKEAAEAVRKFGEVIKNINIVTPGNEPVKPPMIVDEFTDQASRRRLRQLGRRSRRLSKLARRIKTTC